MARIIEKHNNDKEYIFACPICGTIFTEKKRTLYGGIKELTRLNGFNSIRCPNCDCINTYYKYKEYKEE